MQSATPLQRQWRILISLMSRRNGQTVQDLAYEAGVNSRTILRDLNTLRQTGFPLVERVSDHGRKHWAIVDAHHKIPIHFTWTEAVALHLGRQLLDPLAGTHFWHAAQTAFGKIRAMLGESALSQLEKVSKSFLQTIPGRSDYGEKADLIDRLMLAIEDHKIAFVAYQSERATEPVSLELYPYGIVYHRGSLYLIAHSRDHERGTNPLICASTSRDHERGMNSLVRASKSKSTASAAASNGNSPSQASNGNSPISTSSASAIRHFKIDRVTDVDVQTLQFTPDASFDLKSHLANSFGVYHAEPSETGKPKTIRIRFASEAARYIQEKTWHPSQTLKKEKDGSVILEVSLDTTKEIKSWTLSFGPRATVLEPESLRQEIAQDLEQSLKRYQEGTRTRTKSRG